MSNALRKRVVRNEGLPDRGALFLMHGCPRSAVSDSERLARFWRYSDRKSGRTNRNIRCGVEEPNVPSTSED